MASGESVYNVRFTGDSSNLQSATRQGMAALNAFGESFGSAVQRLRASAQATGNTGTLAQLDVGRAQSLKQTAGIAQAEQGVGSAQSQLAAAQANSAIKQAAMQAAEARFNASKPGDEQKNLAYLDQRTKAYQRACAQEATAEQNLTTKVNALESKKANFAISEAKRNASAQKQLDNQEESLQDKLATATIAKAKETAAGEKKAEEDAAATKKKADDDQAKAVEDAAKKDKAAKDKMAKASEDLDTRNKKAFNGIKSAFSSTMNDLNRMVNGFRQAAQGFQEIFTVIAFSVAAPMGYAMKQGISYAMQFENQFAKVKKAVQPTTNDPGKEYEVLTQRIRNLSLITPTASTDLAVFAEQAGQIGIEGGTGVYRFMNLMNKLAIGTNVDMTSITEDMGKIAAAFGMDLNTEAGMSSMEKLASVMDMVAKRTATDMSGIVAAVKDAAFVGPQLKIPARDLVALTGIMINSGVEASAAGTNLSKFFFQLLKNSDKFAKMMAGYSQYDAAGQIVTPYKDAADVIAAINADPVKVVVDAIDSLNRAVDSDKALALKNFLQVAGVIGGKVGAMALSEGQLKEMLKDVDDEWVKAITLNSDYAAMLLTSSSQTKIFQNNMNDLGVTLSAAVLPVLNQIIAYAVPVMQALGKAFSGLDGKTKMLIVGIPLLVVVLTPVLLLITSLFHAVTLFAGGALNVAMSLGGLSFKAVQLLGTLGKAAGGLGKLLVPAGKAIGTIGAAATEAGAGAAEAGVGIGTFLSALAPAAWIVGGVVAALKVLTFFGLDVAKYFTNLATNAQTWGRNMMITYGNGLLGGAAWMISNVVSKVAGWIAKFFEAHSPPETGPLSTIDEWGANLMNTYLKGFLLADFDILSDVGNKIKSVLDFMADMGQIDASGVFDQFIKIKETLAQIIEQFNKTGQVAEGLLSKIGDNMGPIGKDIQKLIRYWLDYEKLQKRLADLENNKKKTLSTYDDEIAKISKMNISAEEKAELMRKAMASRDDELRKIEEEKKATQDASDAAKDKLDWQKAFVEAQLETLDLLKQQKDAKDKTGADAADQVEYTEPTIGLGTNPAGGDPVKDLGEEINGFSDRVEAAKKSLQGFWDAWNGKGFGDGMSDKDIAKWKKDDPEGFKQAQDLYKLGKQVREIWDKAYPVVNKVLGLFGAGDKPKKQEAPKGQSPFIKMIQDLLDGFAKGVDLGDSFKGVMDALNTVFGKVGDVLTPVSDQFVKWGLSSNVLVGILQILIGTLGIVISVILSVAAGIINGIGAVIEFLAKFYAGTLSLFQNLGKDLWGVIVGLWDILTGKWQEGLALLLSSIINIFLDIVAWITKTAVALVSGAIDLILGVLGGITVTLLKVFNQDNAATVVKGWISSIRGAMDKAWVAVSDWFDAAKKTVSDWLSNLFNGGTPTLNLKLNNDNSNTGLGHAAGGVTLRPHMAMVGEGGESEVIAPLSKLPAMFDALYGQKIVGSGSGTIVNINNPVVRDDRDIEKIAKAVERVLSKKANNSMRMGSTS